MNGEVLANPTSLDFGPNGALYVSQQDGSIWEIFLERDNAGPGNGTYTVTDQSIIYTVRFATPNHNDDGTLYNVNTRQVTGILAAGTPDNPILYVTSSDSRIGGGPDNGDVNLDTNSSVLSRLTWNGQQWEKVDMIRGLPRSEENHSANGMDIFTRNGTTYMLLQSGGFTNMGAPSNNFAGASETWLAGVILIVNLTQLEQMEAANGGPYLDPRTGNTPYIYDMPTLNDPEKPDINNTHNTFPYGPGHPMFNATIDLGDPFGGNNGLNQAIPEPGGPVQIFSPGYRNAYDIVITENGLIYTSDNGPNATWGGPPLIYNGTGMLKGDDSTTDYNPGAGDYVTNEFNITNGVAHGDQLHYVGTINDANGTYYGGHPAPLRAFPLQAGVYNYADVNGVWTNLGNYDFQDLLEGVSGYFNSEILIGNFQGDLRQGDYTTDDISNPDVNILDIVNFSTNGICEYTASNFEGQLQGNILTASFNGNINRYVLDASGTTLVSQDNAFLGGFGSNPLDVIAQGDNDIYPGTIWAATYGTDNITIFEPVDFISCLLPEDPGYDPQADYDGDGYTNQDEEDNGTNPCSAGSQPNDKDEDGISDLNDPDDDNDGIPDLQDVFAIDPDNGTTTSLPISYDFFNNDPGTGFFGLGFTGLMLDPDFNTDYLDQYVEDNLSFGGAAGKATVDIVGPGDALGSENSQSYGFQFGVNVDQNSPPFTIQSVIETPFNGTPPAAEQSYGIFIGTGGQDNYLKLVISDGVNPNDGIEGFDVVLEENDVVVFQQEFDVPGLLQANGVTLYMSIDPSGPSATAFYSLNSGISINSLNVNIPLPASFLDGADNQGMAVGLISTAGDGPSYTATWDNLMINQDQPGELQASASLLDFGTNIINGSTSSQTIELTNNGGAMDPIITVSDLRFTGPDASMFTHGATLPLNISPGENVLLPVNLEPGDTPGILDADLEIIHSGTNSPIIIDLQGELQELSNASAVRINAGGGQETYDGRTFDADQFFTGGKVFTNLQAQVPVVFQTERSAVPAQFSYDIPLPAGNYTVNLYFAEIYWGATGGGTGGIGSRVFDVSIEGELELDNFDIFAEAGAETVVERSFDVTVDDGTLNIFFDATVAAGGADQPKISAIEILSTSNQVPQAVIGSSVTSGEAPLTVNFTGSDSQDDDGIASYFWDFGDGSTSQEINPQHTFTDEGTYTVSLTVVDTNGASDTTTLQIQVNPSGGNNGFELRINAGGPVTSYNGNTFQADQFFVGGKTYTNSNVQLPLLFQTERSALPPVFEYAVPVENGEYQIILHFAEIYWGATGGGPGGVGSRIFDVQLEGELILDNFDIFQQGGAETIVTESFVTQVNDGVLNVYFSALAIDGGVNQPKLSAMEIIGLDGNGITPIVIQNIPDQNSQVNELVNLSVGASGGDPNQNYTYALNGAPAGVQIEPTNGLISGVIAEGAESGGPLGDGVYDVIVTVSQTGITPAQENFTWTVTTATTQWSLKNEPETYFERSECSFVQAGDKFYLFGGRQSPTTIDIYDYTTNTWESLDDSAPFDFNHVQAVTYDGLIWVVGGFQDNAFPNEASIENVWIFNPATGDWYQGPEIPADRQRGSGGVVVFDNKIYLLGGNISGHDGGYVPYFDEFDPVTGTWTSLSDAPRARDHFHAIVVNGVLYAIGGRLSGGDGGTFAPLVPEVDVYDFATQSWSTLPSGQNIPTPRAGQTVANFNNEIHVMGGEVESLVAALNTTEIYNPASATWSAGPDMNFGRHGTQAISSGGGLFVTGGSPTRGGGSQRNMEFLYSDTPQGNPSTDSELQAVTEVPFNVGETNIIDLTAVNGNIGVWINSVELGGSLASEFQINTIPVSNRLINANSTWAVTVEHIGSTSDISVPLVVTYNNTSTLTINLIVGASTGPTALAEADPTSGEIPLEVSFTGSGSTPGDNPIVSYAWDFGDGGSSTEADPTYTYNTAGEYTAVLTVTDDQGLQDTDQVSITVTDPVQEGDAVVSFTLVNAESDTDLFTLTEGQIVDINQVAGTGLNIRANTNPAVVGSVVLNLTGPVNNTRTESVAPYALFGDSGGNYFTQQLAEGDYTITATPFSASGGGGTPGIPLTLNFSIGEPTAVQGPTAVASSDVAAGDAPLEVTFNGSGSIAGDNPIVGYEWDFGDGNSSTLADPVHTYAAGGDFTAILTVTDELGLEDTDELSITVNTPQVTGPTAIALSDVVSGDAPLEVTFNGSGSIAGDNPIVGYEWDFGDGNSSTLADPVHTYAAGGNYTAVLTVTDDLGLEDTDEISITVNTPQAIGPTAVALSDITSGEVPLEVVFSGSGSIAGDNPIVAYEWDFGDGGSSTAADPTYTYNAAGNYIAVLTVTDGLGLEDSDEINISVSDPVQEGDAVVSFTLVNADTNNDLFEISQGANIDLNSLGGVALNIRANTNPAVVGSVVLILQGPQNNSRAESVAPYALFGDVSGNYNPGTFTPGDYTLTATPFSSSGGGGTAGTPLTVNFSVTNVQVKPSPGDIGVSEIPENITDSGEVTMYPNPAQTMVYITGLNHKPKNGGMEFHLHDLKGSIVKTLSAAEVYGSNRYAIPVDDLQQGVYVLSLTDGGKVLFNKYLVVGE